MIALTVEELEFLCEVGHSYQIDIEGGVKEFVDLGEEEYIDLLGTLAPRGLDLDGLAEKLRGIRGEEIAYLQAKIEYFTEHPLEIPYHEEWEPPATTADEFLPWTP